MNIISGIILLLLMSVKCDEKTSAQTGWAIGEPEMSVEAEPLFPEKKMNDLVTIKFNASGSAIPLSLERAEIRFTGESALASLASVSVWLAGVDSLEKRELLAASGAPGTTTRLKGSVKISPGQNRVLISFSGKPGADLTGTIRINSVTLKFSDGTEKICYRSPTDPAIRFGRIVRAAGQDGSDTYRIPGLATTKAGTLIAVYDIRYNRSKDLQENIDVGMSRSTDGGQTWEPMKVIMDMDEWGGKPVDQNGVGDPCILVDENTGTIWVAALWLHGFPGMAAWNSSGPGLDPSVTGQFLLVKSDDDGLTWSEEINITSQVKDPGWRLFLQGPGKGITLADGTLVMPAQFRDAEGVPHSTIIWSADMGNSWHTGTGARENTTEAQCVQLSDGSIMLNMRDNRNSKVKDENNGRAVAITRDRGKTWILHPSSNSALPEPVCMASLISADIMIGGKKQRVLFFSNPDNKNSRSDMTIKTSLDEGLTWPEKFQVRVYQSQGYGYSCLTMIDDKTVGILYEGIKDLFFQKIPVDEIINLPD